VTTWTFNKTKFPAAAVFPDGTAPADLLLDWKPWVLECVDMLDGDGAQRHWKHDGAYGDQPWVEIEIYRVIRNTWNDLRMQKMERDAKKNGFKMPTRRR
jgi:hypothetical protein